MSIEDKLQTIAENEPEVYKAGKLALLKDSKYMNAAKSGVAVAINDCSPIEHDLKVKLKAPDTSNLLTAPYTLSDTSDNGITYTINDESISVSGTLTGTAGGVSLTQFEILAAAFTRDTTYYCGITYVNEEDAANYPLSIGFYCSGGSADAQYGVNSIVWSDYTSNYLVIMAQTDIDYTGCGEFIPVVSTAPIGSGDTGDIDLSTVSVIRYGKNIANLDLALTESSNKALSKTENDSYMLTRVSGSTGIYSGWSECYIPKGTPFTVSLNVLNNTLTNTRILFQYGKADKTAIAYNNINISSPQTTITATEDIYYFRLYMLVGETVGNYLEFNEFQIELNSSKTDYEAYTEPDTLEVNADGTVEGLKSMSPNMTFFTDNENVIIECQYYRDIDLYIDSLITSVALTGGE